MNKSLVIIVILSVIYLLLMALSPNAQKVHGKFAKLEYGYINGISEECNINSASSSASSRLHYYIEKGRKKMTVEFFCYDEANQPVMKVNSVKK